MSTEIDFGASNWQKTKLTSCVQTSRQLQMLKNNILDVFQWVSSQGTTLLLTCNTSMTYFSCLTCRVHQRTKDELEVFSITLIVAKSHQIILLACQQISGEKKFYFVSLSKNCQSWMICDTNAKANQRF